MSEQFSPAKIQEIGKKVQGNTRWIYSLLSLHVGKLRGNANVVSLASGGGEELAHLRKLAGEEATIHAVDLTMDDHLTIMAMYARAQIHTWDIRDVGSFLALTGTPDFILNRHPRVIPSYDTVNGIPEVDEWWAPTLAIYAQLMSNLAKPMLITTMHEDETAIITDELKRQNVPHTVKRGYQSPPELRIVKRFHSGKIIEYATDSWVIKI